MSEQSSGTRLRAAVAEEVRVLLARRRLSGVQLANRIGRSQAYVSRRLTGDTAFDVDDLEVIARELGVSVQDLFAGPGPQTTGAKLQVAVRPTPHAVDPRSRSNGRPRREVKPDPQPNTPAPHKVNPSSRRPVRVQRAASAAIPLLPATA